MSIGYRCLVALLGVAFGLTIGNYVWADTTALARPKPRHVVVCVEPVKGLMGVENWTEKQLRKSIAECQRWCDRENAREEAGRRLAAL